jgi:hypothetical protein
LIKPTDLAMVKKQDYGDDGLWDTGGISLAQAKVSTKVKVKKGMTSFIAKLAVTDIATA